MFYNIKIMKKYILVALFGLLFISNVAFASSVSIVDNMDGSVNVSSADASPWFTCYNVAYNIADDNIHSANPYGDTNPLVMTPTTAGTYTCFVYDGTNMPLWPTSNLVYQNTDGYTQFEWNGTNISTPAGLAIFAGGGSSFVGSVGLVVQNTLGSISPLLGLVIGLVLVFVLIALIIDLFRHVDEKKTRKGYKADLNMYHYSNKQMEHEGIDPMGISDFKE